MVANKHLGRGFTLIEMVLSIALGMLIVYAALSGFRAATQSIAISNRMSLENSLIRAGFQAALNEVDFWTSYDDPDDNSRQGLRNTVFRDLSSVMGNVGLGTQPTPYPGAESDIGWDPHYEWPVADRRTWWRGNAAESRSTDLRMGSYAIFADKAVPDGHPWLYRQMDGLRRTLGYYGFCDYLLPNQLYALVDSSDRSKNTGGIPELWVQPGSSFRNGDGNTHFTQGLAVLPAGDTCLHTPMDFVWQ
jgi:prepilin-type N-terminal cleavage/methylation domain-containing protein